MKKEFIGILICLLIIGTVLPVTGYPTYKKSIEEPGIKLLYVVKFDLVGKGEVNRYSPTVFWEINEGEATTFAILSFDLNEEDIINSELLKSDTIISPASGILMFFVGSVDFNNDSGVVEIHGSAIMSVSGPIS